jgi:hypothetical protein
MSFKLYSSHLQARKRQEEEEEVRQLERREEEQELERQRLLQVIYPYSLLLTLFQLYRGCQFIGGRNRNRWRKPPTCHKPLTNFIT